MNCLVIMYFKNYFLWYKKLSAPAQALWVSFVILFWVMVHFLGGFLLFWGNFLINFPPWAALIYGANVLFWPLIFPPGDAARK